MKKKRSALFEGLTEREADLLVGGCRAVCYGKGETVFHEGETCDYICLVRSGVLEGVRFGVNGERDVVNVLCEGDIFGDVLALSGGKGSPVTVCARELSCVTFIPLSRILGHGSPKVMKNLVKTVSEKYFALLFRLNCVSCKTLRDKVVYYLMSMSGGSQSPFMIPLDRAGLADFLCADRSALSRELSAMKSEGIIDFYRNTFRIISFDKAHDM